MSVSLEARRLLLNPGQWAFVLCLQTHRHLHVLILLPLFQRRRHKGQLPKEGDQPGQARDAAEGGEAKPPLFQRASCEEERPFQQVLPHHFFFQERKLLHQEFNVLLMQDFPFPLRQLPQVLRCCPRQCHGVFHKDMLPSVKELPDVVLVAGALTADKSNLDLLTGKSIFQRNLLHLLNAPQLSSGHEANQVQELGGSVGTPQVPDPHGAGSAHAHHHHAKPPLGLCIHLGRLPQKLQLSTKLELAGQPPRSAPPPRREQAGAQPGLAAGREERDFPQIQPSNFVLFPF